MRCKKDDSIEQLNLSVKTIFELKRNGIEKIEDLLCYQEKDFSQFRHIQHGRLDEIKNAVHAKGERFWDEDEFFLYDRVQNIQIEILLMNQRKIKKHYRN